MSKKIETDTWTFIKFWAIPGIAYLLYLFLGKAIEGLIVIGLSIFLALALRPLVRKVNNFFTKHFGEDKKHQTLSVVFAYLIVVSVVGAIIAIVGPVVVNETTKFVQNLPETFENTLGGWEGVNNFGRKIGIDNLEGEVSKSLTDLSNNLLGILGNNLVSSVSGITNVIMKIILILILTLLFLLEGPGMFNAFWKNVGAGESNKKSVTVPKRIITKMANVVSTYVSRQVFIAILDGLVSGIIVFFISLFMGLSLNLAIPMGMTTMIFYLIPMFGQFIGGTIVTLILFFSNPLSALIFAIIYIIYAQIENNILAPKIQGNALNLPAIAILIAIIIGMYMFGLLGAIISVPIAGCIRVLIEEYPNIKSIRE